MTTRRAYLSIGTNIGDRRENLQRALKILAQHPQISLRHVSPIYQTQPVGPVVQRNFYNIGLAVDTKLTALELLDWCHVVEQSLHRRRLVHWGPRTIDLDIIFYQNERYDLPRLFVPHPEVAHRRFVLQPLLDVSGDDPVIHQRTKKMLDQTGDQNWINQLTKQGVII